MVTSYTLARVKPTKDVIVYDIVKALPSVKEVITTYGEYDLIIKIEVDSLAALDDFVFNKLRIIEGIDSTTTLISANFPTTK
ncbi:MAG: Lrp/AsnC ligand binding domain-containing protein [Candidatus Bathyarchaeota archaeon]|nr:Lrp/AsnC ligand binding domain-containing protein [Candidatus Bathyarchaeota archaeon]